jgi:2'-5' RNA ligase
VRLFVALQLPEPVRRSIAARVEVERGRLPPASWVSERNLHLTLLFLGELQESVAQVALRAFAEAELVRPSSPLVVASAGGFPERGPIRVVWLALEPAAELTRLADAVRAVARRAELPFDPKPFRSHLTVARCRAPWPATLRPDLARLAPSPAARFAPERVQLISSVLGASGPSYTAVAELTLREAA